MSSWIKESKSRWIVCKIIITAAKNARCMFTSNIWGTMFSASFLILLLLHLVTWSLEWRSGKMELDFGVRWWGLEGEGGANLCVWFNLYMSVYLCMCLCAIFLVCLSLSLCLSVCLCVMMNCLWEEQGSLGRDCCSHFLPKLATSHTLTAIKARSLNLILFYTQHALSCTG